MTNEELLKHRLITVAQIMKEWSEEDEKSCKSWGDKDFNVIAQWHKGRAQAYRLAADWILEIIGEK